MRLTIKHTTTYTYDEPVPYGLQQLRLTPTTGPTQTVLSWETAIEGGRKEVSFKDHHGNVVELIGFDSDLGELKLSAVGEVETRDTHGIVSEHRTFTPLWLFQRSTDLTSAGAGIRALIDRDEAPLEPVSVAQLHALSSRVSEIIEYRPGVTHIATQAEEALARGIGVCQDHAHVFISAARLLGAPARYVSGYLMMDDRVDQDASHAWAEVWVPPLGWVGFDVSNGISPDDRYVRVATGLDYQEASPMAGVRLGGNGEQLHVSLQVQQ